MLARIGYMIFLAGGAVWLWAAQLSGPQTYAIGLCGFLLVARLTDTTSRYGCDESFECRTPSLGLALCCACVGAGLAAWTVAQGGLRTITEDWGVESSGRLLAWGAVVALAPFVDLAVRAKNSRVERQRDIAQRAWERDDWQGG